MAQVVINGIELNAYIASDIFEVITKSDKIKSINLIYFNCMKMSQRDEESFFKAFQSHVVEGYGFINPEEEIEVLGWSSDKKDFDDLSEKFRLLKKELVEKAMG